VKAFYKISLLSALLILLTTCRNDLELNAPYKEIPTIYAVLNPQDPVQTIRINKVFLGEGDANVMAKVHDSVNYGPGELTVTLERYLNGTQTDASPGGIRTITFSEGIVKTAEGAFNTDQRVYTTDKKLFTFGEYRLTVKNKTTGNIFKAKAEALDSVNGNQGFFPIVVYPEYPYSQYTDPVPLNGYVNYFEPDKKYSVRFVPLGKESNKYVGAPQVYNLVMRIYILDSLGALGNKYQYVDYSVGTKYVKDFLKVANVMYVVNEFFGRDILQAIAAGLKAKNVNNNNLGRRNYRIDFLVYSSSQEYLDYLQYTRPSTSLSQQLPLYSNFEDKAALGLFTFRNRCTVTKQPSNDMINMIANNSMTCPFRFFDSNLQVPECK